MYRTRTQPTWSAQLRADIRDLLRRTPLLRTPPQAGPTSTRGPGDDDDTTEERLVTGGPRRPTPPQRETNWLPLVIGLVVVALIIVVAALVLTGLDEDDDDDVDDDDTVEVFDDEDADEEAAENVSSIFYALGGEPYIADGYRVEYPEAWFVIEDQQNEEVVIFVSSDDLRANVQEEGVFNALEADEAAILMAPIDTNDTAPAVVQQRIDLEQGEDRDFSPIETSTIEDTTVAHTRMLSSEFEFSAYQTIVAAEVEGAMFVLNGFAAPERDEDLLDAMLGMAMSIDVEDGADFDAAEEVEGAAENGDATGDGADADADADEAEDTEDTEDVGATDNGANGDTASDLELIGG